MKPARIFRREVLAAANRYLDLGLGVIPLIKNTRNAAVAGYHGHDRKVPTRSTLNDWFDNEKGRNLSIVPGYPIVDGQIDETKPLVFVVDYDPRHGGTRESVAALCGGEVPTTPEVDTPSGGGHIYLTAPAGTPIRNSIGKLAPGIDIRASGGLAYAPPTRTAKGMYIERAGHHLGEVPFAAAPPVLIDKILAAQDNRDEFREAGSDDDDKAARRSGFDYLKALTGVPEGERDQILTQAAWHFLLDGVQPEVASREILKAAAACNPPFDPEIAQGKVFSAFRKQFLIDKTSKAAKLANQIAAGKEELFLDETGNSWIRFSENDHLETHLLKSREVTRYLILHYKIKARELNDLVAQLDARAKSGGKQHKMFLRTGWHEGSLYIDRGSPQWDAFQVTDQGWTLVGNDSCPVYFKRSGGTGELPIPERGGSMEEFRLIMQIEDRATWALLLAYLVGVSGSCGDNDVSVPHLQILGPHGSGKSGKAKGSKYLIDPDSDADWLSDERTGTSLKSPTDLAAAVTSNRLIVFGNLSALSDAISDLLCCLSTGAHISNRELYTNFKEMGFRARRSVILTAIKDIVVNSDLLDRLLILRPDAPKTPAKDRDLRVKLTEARPRILGALLDGLVYGLAHPAKLESKQLPRLADFADWAASCLPFFGIMADEFVKAYEDNRSEARQISLEGSPLYVPLLAMLKGMKGQWHGTAGQLREVIEKTAPEYAASREFPKTPIGMSNALKAIELNLKSVGIEVVRPQKREGHDRERVLTIQMIGNSGKESDPPGLGNENVRPEDRDLVAEVLNGPHPPV